MLNELPDDVEEAITAWLAPLRDSAITRRNDDPLPFTLIRHLDGQENVDEGTADHLVSVRTLCDKSLGEVAARDECDLTHRRMLRLARYLPDIPLSSGRNASIDYVKVFESPRWETYENDQILCKRARYQIGLSYSPAP